MTTQHYDVVVGGAGIVGAALALSLARLDHQPPLSVALVEPKAIDQTALDDVPGSDHHFDARVVALNESSRRVLEQLGVWEQVTTARVCPYTNMQVRDSEGTGSIEFHSADIGQANLGHIVENSLLLNSLLSEIEHQSNIELLCPDQIQTVAKLDDNQHSLGLNNSTITTSLLVAADGSYSTLRQICDFSTRQWDYGHQAIVATLRGEKSHDYTARQWFMQTGPLAFLPMQSQSGDSQYVSIVWSQAEQRSEQLMAMSDEEFCRELALASEHVMGQLELVSRRYAYPLRQCHAQDYVQAGIALIGDAAHTIHPLAGQGVNLGLADVRVLGEELESCLSKGLDIGSVDILRRYQRRRKPENLAVMATMEGFKRLFERDEPALRLLRNVGMNRLDALGPVKNALIKRAMGL